MLVGFAAMLLLVYTVAVAIEDSENLNVLTLMETCPAWLIGPALASLLAAYMSTMDTHMNWGASYLINDFYKPYVKPNQSAKHYVYASHIATVVIALAGLVATSRLSSIIQGWGMVFGLMSGMGIVGILRWTWWRVTAWTEIGCMIGAGLATGAMQLFAPDVLFPFTLLFIVPISMLSAAIGTFAFSAEPRNVLVAFANRVRPPGPGWRRVTQTRNVECGTQRELDAHLRYRAEGLLRPTICWLMGTAAIYCAMFGVGDLLLKSKLRGTGLCATAVVLTVVVGLIYRSNEMRTED